MSEWISQNKAAKEVGCSQQYISMLIKMGMPSNSRKQVRLSDVRSRLKRKNGTGGDPDYWKERAKHEQIKAQLAELELKRKKEELVPLDQVQEHLEKMFSVIKQKLISLPSRITHLITAEKKQAGKKRIFEEEIREVLLELSNFDPNEKNKA